MDSRSVPKEVRGSSRRAVALDNAVNRIVDFRIFHPVRARFVRLSWRRGTKIDLGLTECTVFAPPSPVRVY